VFLDYAKTITPNIIPFDVNKQLVIYLIYLYNRDQLSQLLATLTDIILTRTSSEGVVLANFHFAGNCANILTDNFLDPEAKTPECKVCAVRIKKESGEMAKVAV
jgi:hypothetical protein